MTVKQFSTCLLCLFLCLIHIINCQQSEPPSDVSNQNKLNTETNADSAATTTTTTAEDLIVGGEYLSEIDPNLFPKGKKISQREFLAKVYKSSLTDKSESTFELITSYANLGMKHAKLYLAKMLFYGDVVELDLNSAYLYFREMADLGDPEAHLYLGFFYSIGLGPAESNQALALLHYTFAAMSEYRNPDYYENHLAKMALGYRYSLGIGVKPNCEYSLSQYRVIAKKVSENITFAGSNSILRIRLLDEIENPGSYSSVLDDDLIHYYQFLAEKGDIQAQVGLGQLHFQGGRGVLMNPNRAYQYFKMAAESGNTNAMAFLGKMYMEGLYVERDYDTSYKYFQMAAEKGNPIGQSGLGIIYLYGRGVEKDYKKALKYFSQASTQGWVDGQLYLGLMYLKGHGVTRDYSSAIKYFTMASQSGHVLGLFHLGEMYDFGTGIMRSCGMAVDLYKSVSEKGPWGSLLSMAYNNYKEGKKTNAFIKYAVLSELGYEVAQSNSAFMLDRNEVNELFEEAEVHNRAFMYWSRSAAQGYSIARVKLGDYHYYGLGTKIDYEMAVNQYRLASDNQNAQALFNLGYMYEKGLGLKRDIYLAKRYYDLAATASSDAQVPVALALIKLCFIFVYEYLQNVNTKELSMIPDLSTHWDLYTITFLTLALGTIIYLRRQGAG